MIYYHSSTDERSSTKASVVLVHGLTCDHSDWSLQFDALAPECHVVSVDLRGHGKSTHINSPLDMDTMAADVIEVCTHLGIEAAVFAGHSMGTRVIAAVAEQQPQLAQGLLFVDGSRQAQDNLDSVLAAVKNQLTDAATSRNFIKNMFEQMFTDDTDPNRQHHIVQRAMDTPWEVFQDLKTQLLIWDSKRMESVFQSIRAPVRVLQSTTLNSQRERRSLTKNDSVPYLDFIQTTIPQARTEIITHAGHFTQLDAPERVTSALRDMLGNNPKT